MLPVANESSRCDSALPEHPRQQPGDRLDHHEDGHLAARQDVVAERDLDDRNRLAASSMTRASIPS
jgi:hypothetical protein